MPTWSGILEELVALRQAKDPALFDKVRRKYLAQLHALTGRNVIIYASQWTQGDVPPALTSIVEDDLNGLMEVIHGLSGPNLDLILHSPGGSPSAAEAFVLYLRSNFENVRVVVPQMAMSAATMVACAADVVLMGKHSFLGPTDPQLMMSTPTGRQAVPAQAILDEFEQAVEECQDPKRIGAWLPKLGQYSPGLLVQCKNACELSRILVRQWLAEYMFKDEPDAEAKAESLGHWLADHGEFKIHSRPLSRTILIEKGLKVEPLEENQDVQDAFLSVFHAVTHTFNGTPAVKIIENHLGKAYLKQVKSVGVPIQFTPAPLPPAAPKPAPQPETPEVNGQEGVDAPEGDGPANAPDADVAAAQVAG